MIQIEGVTKEFSTHGGKIEAVKDVSLHIREGEIFGIIGFSGAGKSTLVRCINLLERPTTGSVKVDDVELTLLDGPSLRKSRKKIGMIFQQFNLMPSRSVFQNIAYPLKGSGLSKQQIEEKVLSLLELVDLTDKERAYPSQLSGGQKQRVAIARALANDPKVLLCDEATSALDPQNTLSILELIRDLNAKLGITVVVITHEMSVVKEICNRLAVMENGEVVEQGDVFSIFSMPKHPVTKGFIDTTSSLQKIYTLIEHNSPVVNLNPGEKILKLRYLDRNASEPIISAISRKHNINANIIFGNIEIIQNAPLGGLIVILSGDENNIADAIKYLIDNNVEVEVIDDGKPSK